MRHGGLPFSLPARYRIPVWSTVDSTWLVSRLVLSVLLLRTLESLSLVSLRVFLLGVCVHTHTHAHGRVYLSLEERSWLTGYAHLQPQRSEWPDWCTVDCSLFFLFNGAV